MKKFIIDFAVHHAAHPMPYIKHAIIEAKTEKAAREQFDEKQLDYIYAGAKYFRETEATREDFIAPAEMSLQVIGVKDVTGQQIK